MELKNFIVALADVKGKSSILALRVERCSLPLEERYEIESCLGALGRSEHPADLSIVNQDTGEPSTSSQTSSSRLAPLTISATH